MNFVIVPIDLELFVDNFLRPGEHHFRVDCSIPEDAVLVAAYADEGERHLRLKFCHESFSQTPKGKAHAEIVPQFTGLEEDGRGR